MNTNSLLEELRLSQALTDHNMNMSGQDVNP